MLGTPPEAGTGTYGEVLGLVRVNIMPTSNRYLDQYQKPTRQDGQSGRGIRKDEMEGCWFWATSVRI